MRRPLECGQTENNYHNFSGFINSNEAISLYESMRPYAAMRMRWFVNTVAQHRRSMFTVFVYLLNKNTNTFPSAFRPLRTSPIVHETRLLVLSGFTLTVIHMNVSSRNPKNTKRDYVHKLAPSHASVLSPSLVRLCRIQVFPGSERKLCGRNRNCVANKPFHIENDVVKMEPNKWQPEDVCAPCNLCADEIQRANSCGGKKRQCFGID